ncbi:DNA mismatch repair endonuclease MutL [Tepidibacter thalassicus]|uniref:DNA mismatch repair protein MutL n=1 Tax=Tepidibacter thalassicus DSM 15285 TaxID=1123350 RepID=A0A1M5P094_9FIRM|nr:DNA mismatch repair endonuclease MutL [Tepidibacter thalassicus]SHG95192.1 DNA mismatch repair protein MutL [Tepidibacter thalassicus DSM 15285]
MIKKINLLDEYTVNKIAAGEVVERPSSVVKELIENSIDANSSKITIEIQDGGKNFIRITDNGHGIPSEEVEKSFLRHATSKISKIDDLYSLNSLGFRGEALASIASVSKIDLITKTNNERIGTKICLEGGNIINKEPIGSSVGTTIIVKDLFFNTPARKKFLKSSTAETISITDMINKLAIGNYSIQFKYINNNKIMLTTPGDNSLQNAIRSIYGKNIANNLIPISINSEHLNITGFIGNNSIYRNNKTLQHVYVNKRYVKSKLILNAIYEAYKGIIPINKHAICFLNLEINPKKIDVNIHPTKLEIKFEDEQYIFNLIKNEINKSLLNSTLIPEYQRQNSNLESKNKIKTSNIINTDDLLRNFNINKIENKIEKNNDKKSKIIEEQIKIDNIKENSEIYKNKTTNNIINSKCTKQKEINKIDKKIPDFNVIGTLFNTYIICQEQDSLFLIDQHAAHERILYEKYMEKFYNETISSQILLEPIILELSNKDMLIIEDKLNIFKKFGFEVELFGNNSIVIRSVPNMFGVPESEKFILDIIDNLNELLNNYALKKEKIASIACKSAIKAYDNIQDIEINKLISDLKKCNNPFTCPHGRPIIVEMKKYEIEKMFKRII